MARLLPHVPSPSGGALARTLSRARLFSSSTITSPGLCLTDLSVTPKHEYGARYTRSPRRLGTRCQYAGRDSPETPVLHTKDIIATIEGEEELGEPGPRESEEDQSGQRATYVTYVSPRPNKTHRVLSKRTIYTIPNEILVSALTREHKAAVRVKGSFYAPWI